MAVIVGEETQMNRRNFIGTLIAAVCTSPALLRASWKRQPLVERVSDLTFIDMPRVDPTPIREIAVVGPRKAPMRPWKVQPLTFKRVRALPGPGGASEGDQSR